MLLRMFVALTTVLFITPSSFDATTEQATSDRTAYVCNLATVYRLKPGYHLVVHSGPGKRFSKIGKLDDGATVYICDEKGDWLNVFYRGRKGVCESASKAEGLDVRKTAHCESGWVTREQVDIISG